MEVSKGYIKNIFLNAYKALVESVLLYNCGTWALDQSDADKIDTFQRKLLRQIVGYKWYDKVTNEDLYALGRYYASKYTETADLAKGRKGQSKLKTCLHPKSSRR